MTDQETLERAINLAIDRGWKANKNDFMVVGQSIVWNPEDGIAAVTMPYEQIVYAHPFAKALWGRLWQMNLQGMVISPNPLEYLAKHV